MLSELYNKRYCLPGTYNILAENVSVNEYVLLKSNMHNHIGFIFEDGKINLNETNDICMTKPDTNIISYGINSCGIREKTPGCIYAGVHAEIDAINKLPIIRNKPKHKYKRINLCITRLSIAGRMLNSKPCNDCIKKMKYLTKIKGYQLKYIYYSNEYGNIVKTCLSQLEVDKQHYSFYYRNRR